MPSRIHNSEDKKLTVLYDHQAFSLQPLGGISRYFNELTQALGTQDLIQPRIITGISQNRHLRPNSFNWSKRLIETVPQPLRAKMLEQINRTYVKAVFSQQKFDVFHPTYYNPYFLPLLKDQPFVLTVHDMTHEIFQDIFPLSAKVRKQKKKLIQQASQIIAISKNTKRDLLQHYDLQPEKVHVVYLGPSHLPVAQINLKLPKRFLLFVGNRGQYKNFTNFLRAAAQHLKRDTSLQIISVGGGKFSTEEKHIIESLGIANQLQQMTISDQVLQKLYQKALAFVYPSLYEGFGLPILEAFQTGCPVACSQASCFPEIAQDAALYFDPRDLNSMSEKIGQVLQDGNLRKKLIKKGYQRVKDFSWTKTAMQTALIYKLAVKKYQ